VLQTADGWSMGPVIVVAILTGTVIGIINNGFVVVKLGVNSFIATLGMGPWSVPCS